MKNVFVLAMAWLAVALVPERIEAQETHCSSNRECLAKKELKSSAVRFRIRLLAGSNETVILEIETSVVDGWHLYPIQNGDEVPSWLPTTINFDPFGLEAIEEGFECSIAPTEKVTGNESQPCLSGKFKWKRDYRHKDGTGSFGGAGSIEFQACNDSKCLPPETLKFDIGESLVNNDDGGSKFKPKFKPIGRPMKISLEPCKLERPKVKLSLASLLLSSGRPVDKLTLKGSLRLVDQPVDFYLPRERQFRVTNQSSDNTRFGNESTYVSVDQNGDGVITKSESYPANLPFRIDNRMFKIVDLSKKEKQLTIQQVDYPLFGTVIGQPCPPFEYTSLDGTIISDKSIHGKVTILDIWAVT